MPLLKPKGKPVATTSEGTAATVAEKPKPVEAQKETTVTIRTNPAADKAAAKPAAPAKEPVNTKAMILPADVPGLPSYLAAEAVMEGSAPGLENATGIGPQIPLLLLAQGQGKATQEFHRGIGDAYLSTDPSEAVFSPGQTVDFVAFYQYPEYILWAPRANGGGMVDRSKDPKGNLAILANQHLARRMKMKREELLGLEECVAYLVFLIYLYDTAEDGTPTLLHETPIALPFSRSKFKSGVKIIQLAKMRAVSLPGGGKASVPLYAGKYSLGVTTETAKRGGHMYQNWAIENSGWVPEKDMPAVKASYERARDEFADLKLAMGEEEEVVVEVDATVKGAGEY